MGIIVNVNCIHRDRNRSCTNKKRRWFFGLFQDASCPEEGLRSCELKIEKKRPNPPPRPPSFQMSTENELTTKIDKLIVKINKLKSDIEIIYCNQCHTYFEELEGVSLPDFSGKCPLCGEENEWEVKNILDGRNDIIKLLNSGDLKL